VKKIQGELTINPLGGVIWFNDENGICRLRISKLPPMALEAMQDGLIDLTMGEMKDV
jgi:hypothetical protein